MDDVLQLALDIIDSDDSDLEIGPLVRRPRRIKERFAHFDDYDEVDFAKRFRLSKRSALDLLELVEQRLEFPTFEKNQAVTPINQLLLCLRYYATGCTQLSASDFSGVSQPTAQRIVHRVTAAIASLHQDFISMPRTEAETSRVKYEFYRIARFPRVIGSVDCSHIKIRSPGGNDPEYYRNRKGYFSINCQVIGNANLEIQDIVARWPGSSHDTTIFDQCRQRALFEAGNYGDSVLVGDSGYPCRQYLMVPLPDPNINIQEEVSYNESQIRTRNPIERLFGVWKRRFPVLALGINTRVEKALPIIVATGVLHNMLRRNGDPLPPDDEELHLPMPWEELIEYGQVHNQNVRGGCQDRNPHRRALINDYFRTLHVIHGNR